VKEDLAAVTLARKIAAIALRLWKKGELSRAGQTDTGTYEEEARKRRANVGRESAATKS